MANSRYSYVRLHELPDPLLPSTFLILRLDGKAFHKFSSAHNFTKPNDRRALDLMNAAARRLMAGRELMGDLVMGFGESDEYRSVYEMEGMEGKLVSLVSSLFTSAYTFLWPQYFPDSPLELDQLPIFDGRIVQYCTETEVKDYFRWRQVDAHINNLYNTCFWTLVQKGSLTTQEANSELSVSHHPNSPLESNFAQQFFDSTLCGRHLFYFFCGEQGTLSSEKQEMLFSRFGMNYNHEEEMFKKGSIWIWIEEGMMVGNEVQDAKVDDGKRRIEEEEEEEEKEGVDRIALPNSSNPIPSEDQSRETLEERKRRTKPSKSKRVLKLVHEDLIKEKFWTSGYGKGVLEG
ncbi:BZ3500_MvSof-1268-A1-R1_Chr11-1g03159 [Microbotryum saponariae]|uniref:tRNA(His) guanylyltransferase n=1 Tax=Microbotryum saponariae TaxID=289078 RepID=A0A2X0N6E4_9BASI|nr:BZ3501_MvSof-1269-A2-R1_Chr11g02734 [Microbotryum saponariae]SDA03719.1 BZ3500_MvSof-1268-A1-R1_Chr11-1g03159 [Microbotryum saponariae]